MKRGKKKGEGKVEKANRTVTDVDPDNLCIDEDDDEDPESHYFICARAYNGVKGISF